jgi:hypothetical protein
VTARGPAPTGGGFVPNGTITLLTDFGTRDPFVGAMKGRILEACPRARVVDLTHEVAAYRPAEAGFWLERLRGDFAAGTVHLAIVDPGVGTARRFLAVLLDGQVLLAPDNGLLGNLASLPGAEVRAVSAGVFSAIHREPSSTFHGRDLFAPLAAGLAAGAISFEQIGSLVVDPVPSAIPWPQRTSSGWAGEVLLVDRFGNLFSNIEISPARLLEAKSVRFGGYALPAVRTYGEAQRGCCVALVNAFGVLEAACVEGSAAESLGLAPGAPVELDEGPAGLR